MLCLPAARSISHQPSSVNCDHGLFHDVCAYLGDKQETDVNFKGATRLSPHPFFMTDYDREFDAD